MVLYYLSDLHLRSPEEEAAQRFERFLREVPQPKDIVVLGGDIFDLFVGNKRLFKEKYKKLLEAMRGLADSGVTIYYLEGNHDFHLANVFSEHPNILIKEDEFEISVFGRKLWISHGDLIDPEDTGYRFLRLITRSYLFRTILNWLPDDFVDIVGNWSSKTSRKYNHVPSVSSPSQERLRKLYFAFAREKVKQGYDHVLVGHSHIRDQLPIKESTRLGEYVNLGFSADTLLFSSLKAEAQKFEFCSFPSKS